MIDDIIDLPEISKPSSKYTNLSIVCGAITVSLYFYMLHVVSGPFKASDGIPQPSMLVMRCGQGSCMLGLIFMVLSFVKSEPLNWKKCLGVLLNSFLFIVIIGAVCFAYYMDLNKLN